MGRRPGPSLKPRARSALRWQACGFEPLARPLYKTCGFTTAAWDIIEQDSAPLVLHHMGKDAKAIKFMVHLDQDLQPLFTERPEALAALSGPAWVVMDHSDLATPLAGLAPLPGGRFDNNDYVLLHLPATPRS